MEQTVSRGACTRREQRVADRYPDWVETPLFGSLVRRDRAIRLAWLAFAVFVGALLEFSFGLPLVSDMTDTPFWRRCLDMALLLYSPLALLTAAVLGIIAGIGLVRSRDAREAVQWEKQDRRRAALRKKHPTVTDARVLELLMRRMLFRRKMLKAAILFFGGTALAAVFERLMDRTDGLPPGIQLWIPLLALVGMIMSIAGVLVFAKSLHDPLTTSEAQELRMIEELEKTGKTDGDLSAYRYEDYEAYERERYKKASPLGKLAQRLGQLTPIVVLFIVGLFGMAVFELLRLVFTIPVPEGNSPPSVIRCVILFVVSIGLLVYSLVRTSEPSAGFSIFSLFWLMFLAAAIGFAVWGVAMIVQGHAGAGGLILCVGVPMWLGATYLFYKIFG